MQNLRSINSLYPITDHDKVLSKVRGDDDENGGGGGDVIKIQ